MSPEPRIRQLPVMRDAVRWLSPTELARTGLKAALATVFGQYADRREMQQGPLFEQSAFRHGRDGEEFWFDYVSDVGDGFDASYSVATLLAGDLASTRADVATLRRGELLVMGGDQVYPSADVVDYEERTVGVYAAASGPPPADRPALYAIPGNHDWYDGLTAFLRVFCQGENIGMWCTGQRRSYFALRLPQRWWLLAVDIQMDTYLDRAQLDYFRRIAATVEKGDSIILCTAKPPWYDCGGGTEHRLLYFLDHVLGPVAGQVRLMLSGDKHFYARYTQEGDGDGQMLVTAGHGGAYAAATHLLPETVDVPARFTDPAAARTARTPYVRAEGTWPTREASRREARGVLWRLATRNGGLLPLLGSVYGLIAASGFLEAWLWSVALLTAVAAGCVALAAPQTGGRAAKLGYGASLAVLQVAPAVAMLLVLARLDNHWAWPAEVLAGVGAAVVGGLLAAELLALWLLVVSRRGVNVNELFAAQSIEDHKGFLRFRIDRDGVLHLYPIGLARSVRSWRPSGGAGPVLVPDAGEELRYDLIEDPVTIVPAARG